jgi:hypothetical protein
MSGLPRAICPVCGRLTRLKRNRTYRWHRNMSLHAPCTGYGQTAP